MNEDLNTGDFEQRPSLASGVLTEELDHRSNGKNMFILTKTIFNDFFHKI